MKSAIIVGSKGQDGRLLWERLSEMGYGLLGIHRHGVQTCGLAYSGGVDICSADEVGRVVNSIQPDEVYYLAAAHQSSQEALPDDKPRLFNDSFQVNAQGVVNFLDAIRRFSATTKLFYAASSRVFGSPPEEIQDEMTPINPSCIYGLSKAAGLFACRHYRGCYGVFASVGILYNHESLLRSENFVSKKIVKSAVQIKRGRQDHIELGNLCMEVDWGYAPDYVEAMRRILSIDRPDDFILATGEKHSVREFAEIAFSCLGLDWRRYVRENPALISSIRRKAVVGNPSRLISLTGWRPTLSFRQMVQKMMEEEVVLDDK